MIRTKVRVEDLNFYKQCCDVRKFKIGKVIRIMMTMGIKMIVMMIMLFLMIMKHSLQEHISILAISDIPELGH